MSPEASYGPNVFQTNMAVRGMVWHVSQTHQMCSSKTGSVAAMVRTQNGGCGYELLATLQSATRQSLLASKISTVVSADNLKATTCAARQAEFSGKSQSASISDSVGFTAAGHITVCHYLINLIILNFQHLPYQVRSNDTALILVMKNEVTKNFVPMADSQG